MLKSTPVSGTELTVGINAFEKKNIIMEMSPNTNMSRLLVSVLTVYCLCVYLIEMYLSHREADYMGQADSHREVDWMGQADSHREVDWMGQADSHR